MKSVATLLFHQLLTAIEACFLAVFGTQADKQQQAFAEVTSQYAAWDDEEESEEDDEDDDWDEDEDWDEDDDWDEDEDEEEEEV